MESGSNEDTFQYFQWQVTKEDRDNLNETELMIQSIRFGASIGQLLIHIGVLFAKNEKLLHC